MMIGPKAQLFLSSISFLVSASASFAANSPVQFDFHQKDFAPAAGAACTVKRFTVVNSQNTMSDENGTTSFTGMNAVIEVSKPECLRKYGVVQWIHGCVSNQMYRKSTGVLDDRYYGTRRQHRENDIYFTHTDWVIDATGKDPLYAGKDSTDTGGERMGYYYVSKRPLILKNNRASLLADYQLFDHASSRYFLEDPAARPSTQLYVGDSPQMASTFSTPGSDLVSITIPSLEFKTCLYEMDQIPEVGDPAGPDTPVEAGGPIVCYEWNHKFSFNPATQKMDRVTTPGIDPFCSSPTPAARR
jgi:hypothetical protein